MAEDPRIECVPNGPLRVHGLSTLRNAKGATLATKEVTALRRCGGSSNKPYCDGTHRSNRFSSANFDGRGEDRLDSFQGTRITIHDNRSVCAHAGRCTDGLPKTFRYDQDPFIDPDAAQDVADAQPVILVTPGPYAVVGNVAIDQPFNRGASPRRFTLCRCGGSKNKPFCDGTHWEIGFKDDSD